MTTARYSFPYLAEGQVNAEVDHNDALDLVATFLGLYIEDRGLTTPPAVTEGEVHIVGTGATGAWADQDGNLAIGLNGAWVFDTPENGTTFWIADESAGGIYLSGAYNFRNLAPRIALRYTAGDNTFTTEESISWGAEIAIDAYYNHVGSSITVPDAGLYELFCQVNVTRTAGTGTDVIRLRAFDGASPVAEVYLTLDSATATINGTITLRRVLSLAAGSAITFRITRSSGSGTLAYQDEECVAMISRF